MALILNAALPVLASVIVWGALEFPTGTDGKVSMGGIRVTTAPWPLPFRLMMWGDPAASS